MAGKKILQFPSPVAKTQVAGGIFKIESNICLSCDRLHKDCPHLQRTIFSSHSHFSVTVIHILLLKKPHFGAVLVSLGGSTILLCNKYSQAPACRVAFSDSYSGFFRSAGVGLLFHILFLISYPFLGRVGCRVVFFPWQGQVEAYRAS